MAVAKKAPGSGFPLPPEPDLTPAEIIARAADIATSLVARQAETEKRTYYAEDTHEAFREAGFYRILVPRRYGGYEFGVETFVRVSMALTRGCPSTGWMFTLGAAHALLVATVFGEQVQDEAFADGDFLCPATVMPSGFAEPAEDGGWILNGTYNYCSGAPYASHFVGHALIAVEGSDEPVPMLFIAPRESWTMLDDWGNQLGLKGSGSHSIRFENAYLPAHRTLPTHMSMVSVADGTPGLALHGNPMYAGGPLSLMLLESAVLAVGIARGALDVYEDLMRDRTTLFPPIVGRAQDPDFQYWYGEAAGLHATAEVALLGAFREWATMCDEGPAAFTHERELRLGSIGREVVRLAWRCVEGFVMPTAGSSAIRNGERLERLWRDMSTLTSHAGISVFLNAIANRDIAKAHFGVAE